MVLKRKGGVADDFSDFPLSSPATKIRRLDAELPPIVEEDEPLPLPPNEERALVLFKPLVHSPSSYSLTLHSDLLSGIKSNQFPWSKQCDSECARLIGSQSQSHEHEQTENNNEMALVPWVPSTSYQFSTLDDCENANAELMEADEMGSMMMDVEQEDAVMPVSNATTSISTSSIHYPTMLNLHQGVGGVTEGFHQHCLLPQLPQNTSTPITWTR